MEAMTNTTQISMDAMILAAGMTCYAEDCDVIVMKRPPRIVEEFVAASEVVPPFAGD